MRLLLTFALYVALGCATAPRTPREPDGPLLWSVQRSDLPGRAFLLGSIHLSRPGAITFPPALVSILEAADAVAVEANIEGSMLSQMFSFMRHGASLTPLSRRIGPELNRQLNDRLDAIGAGRGAFEFFMPWVASQVLVVMELQESGFEADEGVDKRIIVEAKRRGAELRYMETVEDQLRLFSQTPVPEQINGLKEILSVSSTVTIAQVDALLDLYVAGDFYGLEELLLSETSTSSTDKAIFQDRNLRFADAVERYLQVDEVVLVVAGAGHMMGPTGMPKLLRERGYAVARVPADGSVVADPLDDHVELAGRANDRDLVTLELTQ